MVRLRKVYEDEEIEVYRSLDDAELPHAIIDIIREAGRPLTWRELRSRFSTVVSDDRLREALKKLIEEDKVVELPDGAFGLPEMVESYVPNPNIRRVRPLVPAKFYEMWGPNPAVLRRAGKPLGELVKLRRETQRASREEDVFHDFE